MNELHELEARAMKLPLAERARLAERLIASLEEDAEVERAWRDEVRRRVDSIQAGEVELVPANEVLEALRRTTR